MKNLVPAVLLFLCVCAPVKGDVILPVQSDAYLLCSYYAGWSTPDGGTTWNAGYTEGEILYGNYGDSSRTTLNVLDSTGPGANGDTYAPWAGYTNHPVSTWYEAHMNGPYARRGLVGFDLTGITAVGTATLALRTQSTTQGGVNVYRGTQAWVETEVSWNEYASGSAWSTGGGDFDNTASVFFATPAAAGWVQVDVTSLVQNALNAGQHDMTFFLLADNQDIVTTYYTRDYTPPGGSAGDWGATLTIADPVPEPGVVALMLIGGALALWRRQRKD